MTSLIPQNCCFNLHRMKNIIITVSRNFGTMCLLEASYRSQSFSWTFLQRCVLPGLMVRVELCVVGCLTPWKDPLWLASAQLHAHCCPARRSGPKDLDCICEAGMWTTVEVKHRPSFYLQGSSLFPFMLGPTSEDYRLLESSDPPCLLPAHTEESSFLITED